MQTCVVILTQITPHISNCHPDDRSLQRCVCGTRCLTPMHYRTGARAWSSAHKLEKKRAYEQRVREVEHASFTPLVLSASGGLGKEATVFYKRLRLASLLAKKWDQPYNQVINWLRS